MKILCMLPAARGVYPEEAAARRIRVIQSYQSPDVRIDVDYMPEVSGFNPFGGLGTPVELSRANLLSMMRAEQAEREGYDAFIPFGMLDIGVELARHRVEMPVIGQAQSAYALASTMAGQCAAIWYRSHSFVHGRQQLKLYNAENLVRQFYAVEMPNDQMPAQREVLFDRFVDLGKTAVSQGAELIICHGMSMCPVEFRPEELAEAIGVPVMEGMGAAVAMAVAYHRLKIGYSRIRYPRSQS